MVRTYFLRRIFFFSCLEIRSKNIILITSKNYVILVIYFLIFILNQSINSSTFCFQAAWQPVDLGEKVHYNKAVLSKKLAKTKEKMAESLIRMLRAGPEVSLRGSPTVSPITAALCSSEPLPTV